MLQAITLHATAKAYFCSSTHPKLADAVRSFQPGVRCLNPCANPVPVFPCGGLLTGIRVIPQANLGRDLQTEVPDRVASLTAFSAMIGSPHRAAIEHPPSPTEGAIEDRMGGMQVFSGV